MKYFKIKLKLKMNLIQVMALCAYPELMNSDMFPLDAKDKAKKFLKSCGGESVGNLEIFPG